MLVNDTKLHIHPKLAESTFRVSREVVKRDVAHSAKLSEVKSQIEYSLSHKKDSVRLDFNNLDENTLPDEVYSLIRNSRSALFPAVVLALKLICSLNTLQMGHSNYMRIPLRIFDVFAQSLQVLDLSDCKLLQTLPEEISKLKNLRVSPCFPPRLQLIRALRRH